MRRSKEERTSVKGGEDPGDRMDEREDSRNFIKKCTVTRMQKIEVVNPG